MRLTTHSYILYSKYNVEHSKGSQALSRSLYILTGIFETLMELGGDVPDLVIESATTEKKATSLGLERLGHSFFWYTVTVVRSTNSKATIIRHRQNLVRDS